MRSVRNGLTRATSGLAWVACIAIVANAAWFIAQRETGEIGGQLRTLRNGEPHERGAAAWELGKAPPEEMDRVVPALLHALGDEDGYVRTSAVAALESMKLPESWHQKVTDQLLPGLKDPDHRVRAQVASRLLELKPDPDEAVSALIGAAGVGGSANGQEETPRSEFEGRPIPSPTDWKPTAEQAALQALSVYAKRGNTRAIAIMIDVVQGRVPGRRAIAIEALGTAAGSDKGALDMLLSLAKGKDLGDREAVIDALGVAVGEEGPLSRSAFEELLRLSDSPDLLTRKQAIRNLWQGSPRYFSEILPALEKGFRVEELSDSTIHSLRQIVHPVYPPNVPEKPRGRPEGLDVLKESRSDSPARRYLAVSLANPSRTEELAIIVKALHDQDPHVRFIVGATSYNGRVTERIRAALEVLAMPWMDQEGRKFLIPILREGVAQQDRSALEALIGLTEDRDPEVRVRALNGLRWGRSNLSLDHFKEIEKPIFRAFRDEDPQVRQAAKSILEIQFQPLEFKFPDSADLFKSREPGERFVSVLTSDPKTLTGIDILIKAVQDSDARIRDAAVRALRDVRADSAHANEVLKALTLACRDKEEEIRQAAAQAKSSLETGMKNRAAR